VRLKRSARATIGFDTRSAKKRPHALREASLRSAGCSGCDATVMGA